MRFIRPLTCLVLFGILTGGAVGATARPALPTIENPQSPDPDLQRFFGPKGLRVIETATRVDVLRINPDEAQVDVTGPPRRPLLGLRTTATRVGLPSVLAARIKEAVLSPRIYRFGGGKGCGRFRPGVVFRFSAAGSTPVDVYLCFACNDLGVLRESRELLLADVTAGRLDLLRVAADALPNDQHLRHLYRDMKARAGRQLTGR